MPFDNSALPVPIPNTATNGLTKENLNFLQVPNSTTTTTGILAASVSNKLLCSDTCVKRSGGVNAPNDNKNDNEAETNSTCRTRRIGVDITNDHGLVSRRYIKQKKVIESKPHIVISGGGQTGTRDLDTENRNPSPRLKLLEAIKSCSDYVDSPKIKIPLIAVTPHGESVMHISQPVPQQDPSPPPKSTSTRELASKARSTINNTRKRKLARQSQVQSNVTLPLATHNSHTKEPVTLSKGNVNSVSKFKQINTENSSAGKLYNEHVTKHDTTGDVCNCELNDDGSTDGVVAESVKAYDGKCNITYSFFRNVFFGLRRKCSKSLSQNSERQGSPAVKPPPPLENGDTSDFADTSPIKDGLANALSSMALVTNSSR